MEKPIGIVMAAGRGTRMRELTDHTPKPMLMVRGKPIIAHVLNGLAPQVSLIVVVVGYLGEQIKEHIGDAFEGVPVIYAIQSNPTGGTLDALRAGLLAVESRKTEGFIVTSADDIHTLEAFGSLGLHAAHKPNDMALIGITLEDKDRLKRFGVFALDSAGRISGIEEKPVVPPSSIINCALYYFPFAFKNYLFAEVQPQPNGELYLTDPLDLWIREKGADLYIAYNWQPVGTPEDLEAANVE